MFKLINSETVPLTAELVERHLNMEPSPTERDLDPSRLKFLQEKSEQGILINFHWAIAKLGSRTLRVNGQHSSTMLHELNGAFPKDLKVHLYTYQVEMPSDLAVLFRQFDSRKSGRTANDVSGAYQNLHSDLAGVVKPIAKLAVEGISYFLKHVEGTMNLSGDDQYSLFDDVRWHPFIKWMGEVHNVKTPELRVAPVAAAMFNTFSINQGEARIFWEKVARGGDEYDESAPTTMLDNFLKTAKDADEKRRLGLKPGNYYQACIYAWNGYRDGKTLKDIRYRVDKGLLSASH